MDRLNGSIDTLSAMQITADVSGMDAANKELLKNKEVLAVVLKDAIEEYKGYSLQQIMDFIEADSITTAEVSAGRTNTRIIGDNVEFTQLNEKTSNFDIFFRAKNPQLSKADVLVNLHIDVEPQKDYRPGYPIEKRGIYYLARSLASQLSVVTDKTDYGCLEKCYSIWICRDNIPKDEQYTISYYGISNKKNVGSCIPRQEDYDLLTLVVIRLGNIVYNGVEENECFDLFRFLNTIMYPHKKDFMETISDYIDFSTNEILKEEVVHMTGLGMSILEEGLEQGLERGTAERLVKSVEANMRNFKIDLETACRGNDITVEEYYKAKELLKGVQ